MPHISRRPPMAQKPWNSAFCSRFFLLLSAIAIWWLLFVVDFENHQQVPTTSVKPSTSSKSVRLDATSAHSATPSSRKAARPLLGYLSRGSQNLSRSTNTDARHRHYQNLRSDTAQPFWRALAAIANRSDPCAGRYVFVHDLPKEFNQDLLDNCHQLSPWTNMCKYTENAGLGPRLEDETLTGSTGASEAWFATNQFAVDVIFHNRMKQYDCLTTDPAIASAFYVPYYAGLDIARHLWGANVKIRDSLPLKLGSWLRERPEWRITAGGRDHFLVGGRITWDFRRLTDADSDWGNKLLYISEIMNMSMLTVEASPYHSNDFAIPYPTYFHPSKDADVTAWQNQVRTMNRTALFSFAGAPRPELSTSIRGQIMDQCRESKHCKLLECDRGQSKCHVPSVVMKLFEESVFCLQPQGDSYTRRSIFDSMIAGCIPVFFHEHSAYTQYVWHLPKDRTKYSVFIPEDDVRAGKVSIEQVLLRYSVADIEAMRAEVIQLIPGLVYNDPRHGRLTGFKDAFDLTVRGVIERVTDIRVRIMQGRDDFMESGGISADDIRSNDLKLSQRDVRQWEGDRRNGEHETQSSR